MTRNAAAFLLSLALALTLAACFRIATTGAKPGLLLVAAIVLGILLSTAPFINKLRQRG